MSQNLEPSSGTRAPQGKQSSGSPTNRQPIVTTALAVGGAWAVYALARRTKTGAAAAAVGLIALTERSMRPSTQSYQARASFTINCSPEQAYSFWHNFENLPQFMEYLESVKVLDGTQSDWTAVGPMNTTLHWRAETTEDEPNRRIAWRSVEGSEVKTRGSVEFEQLAAGRGTLVRVEMEYVPPAGPVGKFLASILGKDPQFTVREDLRRFKALIEAGEIPTTLGQSHGPRGVKGRIEERLFREPQNMSEPQAVRPMEPERQVMPQAV